MTDFRLEFNFSNLSRVHAVLTLITAFLVRAKGKRIHFLFQSFQIRCLFVPRNRRPRSTQKSHDNYRVVNTRSALFIIQLLCTYVCALIQVKYITTYGYERQTTTTVGAAYNRYISDVCSTTTSDLCAPVMTATTTRRSEK